MQTRADQRDRSVISHDLSDLFRKGFDDDFALTITDDESDPAEQRFITIGMGTNARLLVVVYSYRRNDVRIVSARTAERHEREAYEVQL